ncbi:TPA: DUF3892 domain-containing protein [Klebsiella michiganensis]|nr:MULTISPECIES: DUF3892 domain-containing protein [Klebsiella/Raoultella group]MBZ7148197.1 DUF3892 domain-containing protein [Klebsiella michiganensis]MDU7185672.1 DUF3892 domain-containing protein [Klebsiella sp.]QLW91444.1 DUF3892 domain-containing protein [Klebsiella oxytoca]QWU09462.1 DUF3892 domain-containing protein [Raoultella ornithinolytica]HAT3643125.1 DUF3892 domain-containing protein [Raoultella ornithinolytica]
MIKGLAEYFQSVNLMKVIKDSVKGTNYITTRPNGTATDNIENLPEY